jgi:hypothetical protein
MDEGSVKPTGWVVDMRHYTDEATGDLPEAIPERVLTVGSRLRRGRRVGDGPFAGARRGHERSVSPEPQVVATVEVGS